VTSYIFQKIADKGRAEGINSSVRQRDARTWFRETAASIRTVNRNRLLKDSDNLVSAIDEESIGKMYSFFYDPKLKATLPYYDRFPLIIVIGPKDKGFLGINLHYLPLMLRAKLMNELYNTTNNKKFDKTTKMNINYRFLQGAARFRYFAPCVKHYLNNHVASNILNIQPAYWDMALMLPTENFAKANKEKVWDDSRKGFK
jgi:hypothetical protein